MVRVYCVTTTLESISDSGGTAGSPMRKILSLVRQTVWPCLVRILARYRIQWYPQDHEQLLCVTRCERGDGWKARVSTRNKDHARYWQTYLTKLSPQYEAVYFDTYYV